MPDSKNHCCEEWAKQSGYIEAFAGGGMLYPQEMRPSTQIEWSKGWQVNGCCGGGCYVLENLRFCPWCSKELPNVQP